MSAELVAAGFFPPVDKQVWNDALNWQPIPIQTTSRYIDCMLQSSVCKCPSRDILFANAKESESVTDFQAKNQIFFDLLSNYTGEKVNVFSSRLIYDELLIEKELNKTLPDWVANTTMNELLESSKVRLSVTFLSEDIVIKRILGGNLLWTIMDNMSKSTQSYDNKKAMPTTNNTNNDDDDDNDNKINKSERIRVSDYYQYPAKKINFYSAHDVTLLSLLNAIGIPVSERIYYSAAVLLELYIDDDGTPIVEMYLRNKSDDFKPIVMINCNSNSTRCTFKNFLSVNKNVSVEFTRDVCVEDNHHPCTIAVDKQPYLSTTTITAISIYSFITIIVGVLLVVAIRRNKYYSMVPYDPQVMNK